MAFHSKNGWWFERFSDGRVQVTKLLDDKVDSPNIMNETFTANEWASIVASVSQHGDHEPFFSQALGFHGDK